MKTIQTTWWWAAIVSILLHAFLWVWVPQKTARVHLPHVPMEGPQVVFYSTPKLASVESFSGNGKPLWLPALFSLPTSLGFSGRIWEEGSMGKPPENPPVEFAHLLERSDTESPEEWRTNFLDEGYLSEKSSLSAPLLSSERGIRWAPTVETNAYLLMQSENDLFEKNSQRIRVRAGDVWDDGKAWETRAYVSIDGRGAVQYVFLEKTSGSKVRDEKIVQWLKGVRSPARQREVAGWVSLRLVAAEKEIVNKYD